MWRCSLAVNQNAFNSRITSEALEERFRQVFPAQAGAELINDLYASGVIVPTIDFTSIAEGSFLPTDLQQAWDFATGSSVIQSATFQPIITTPGFWQIDLNYMALSHNSGVTLFSAAIDIFDGTTSKPVWGWTNATGATTEYQSTAEAKFVVFLRAGDSCRAKCQTASYTMDVWYRQIADVNGNLVNPLGFSF